MAATSAKFTPFAFKLAFLLLLAISCARAARLNVPKVLLPYFSSVATNFTLEVNAADRCYRWTSSRPDVASVTPVSVESSTTDGCSRFAVVTAVSKTATRLTSIVLAEDPVTGEVLRCDVIVDVIHSIHIVTVTRELYLDDSPEQFEVKALDREENTFSTLDGVEFVWSLVSDTDADQETIVDAHNILQIITFAESNYRAPEHIQHLERRGSQGDTVLVNGIRTGSAKVAVRLKDPAYKITSPDIVRLIVIANIMLNPSLVYLLPGAEVQYKVELMSQTSTSVIPMPSDQYYLDIEKPDICELDTKSSTITALELGMSNLLLKDKNIKIKEYHQPSAAVYVVNPGYLGFQVWPGRKWVLEVGRTYEITIEIYAKDSHKIFPSDNLLVQADFLSQYFDVLSSSKNGTYHVVKTLKHGHTRINGQLKHIIDKRGYEVEITPSIKNVQDVEIYEPIRVSPPVLLFPSPQAYVYPLKATGGSGNYTWTSSQSDVAGVSVKGEVLARTLGKTRVTASDIKNADNKGSMQVAILPPDGMAFLPSIVEAELTSDLFLPLSMSVTSYPDVKMADCTLLPLDIRVDNENIFKFGEVQAPIIEDSCATIRVRAKSPGHTRIRVAYKTGKTSIEADVTVVAFLPLKGLHTAAVVTLGSCKTLLFEGGPQPWVLDSSRYTQTLDIEKRETVVTRQVLAERNNVHAFRVECTKLGEQTLALVVGNGPTAKNQFPVTARAQVSFVCARPVGLHLTPRVERPDTIPACPVTLDSNEMIPVPNYKNLEVDVVVTDSNGRKFDNISSLELEWSLSDRSLADLKEKGVATERSGRSFQTMLMRGRGTGSLQLTAAVNRYKNASPLTPAISKSVMLTLVEDAELSPATLSLFNHPSTKTTLSIEKGSGYFHVETESRGGQHVSCNHDDQFHAITCLHDDSSRDIKVSPVHEGSVTLRVRDLCIVPRRQPRATIAVVGADTVDLNVLDKVQLNQKIIANVRVLDAEGSPLLAEHFSLMSLTPLPGSVIITTTVGERPDPYTQTYIVQGKALGSTTLTVQARSRSDRTIKSASRPIQVFPPLRLDSDNITLIVGAQFQVLSHGGPQPSSAVDYTLRNATVASIASSGLLTARALGHTVVTATCTGSDSDGQKTTYSKATVNVYVVPLTGVRISAPLTRLQAGTQMPVIAVGTNEQETPFTFADSSPPLVYEWSVTNLNVANLTTVYYKSYFPARPLGSATMRLHALRPGRVSIRLRVTSHGHDVTRQIVPEGAKLEDEVQIQIFEKFAFVNPTVCQGELLVTPNTETNIRTNLDGQSHVTYAIMDGDQAKNLVKFREPGYLVTGSNTGRAAILVTSHEEYGRNQSLVLLVKVKAVSYMMVNVETIIPIGPGCTLSHIPVGTTTKLSVTYHDDTGVQFQTTNRGMKYRQHRYDQMEVSAGAENGTMVSMATHNGQTVLKVWDSENSHINDYISLHAAPAISPDDVTATLGDVICFATDLTSIEGHTGQWRSSSDILNLDRRLGVAVASRTGSAHITYHVTSDVTTSVRVVVQSVSSVHLDTSKLGHVTNVQTTGRKERASYIVPVTLRNAQGKNSQNIIGQNCSELLSESSFSVEHLPFTCDLTLTDVSHDVTASDLFHVKPEFNTKTGQYACRLTPSPYLNAESVSHLATNLELTVTTTDSSQRRASQRIDFLPSFHAYTSEILLSDMVPLTSIRVGAVSRIMRDLKVLSSDPSIVEILSPEPDSQSPTIHHYPARLIPSGVAKCPGERLDMFVELVSPSTGQKVKIPIKIRIIGGGESKPVVPRLASESPHTPGWTGLLGSLFSGYQSLIFFLLTILGTLLVAYFGHILFMKTRVLVMQPGSGVASPHVVGPSGDQYVYYSGSPPGSPPQYASPRGTRLWSSAYDYTDASRVGGSFLDTSRSPSRAPYQ